MSFSAAVKTGAPVASGRLCEEDEIVWKTQSWPVCTFLTFSDAILNYFAVNLNSILWNDKVETDLKNFRKFYNSNSNEWPWNRKKV